MPNNSPIQIKYFSDLLCVWAYVAQIRIDEINKNFKNKVMVEEHFVSVFGAVDSKMQESWAHRGGIKAYNNHVLDVATQFPHVKVNPKVWLENTPTSSESCHHFIKAVQLVLNEGEDKNTTNITKQLQCVIWQMREDFFKDLRDISNISIQMSIAEKFNISRNKIEKMINTGRAFAALSDDRKLKEKYNIQGSPSIVLNDGRQILYGNIGYKTIEANVNALINSSISQASWC